MDDLVKRLRDWQVVHPCDADKPEGHLYEESAARIETLERQIAAAYAYSASVTGETALLGQVSADAEAHMDKALNKAYEEGRAQMSDDLRNRVTQAIQAVEIPESGWPEDRAGVWVMALDEAVKAADAALAEIGGVRVPEQYCAKCGAPRSNHPYRHPFVSEGRPSIEPAPASVREATRVLCGSAETPFLEPASAITRELRNCGYLVPVRIIHKVLRAIAEWKE